MALHSVCSEEDIPLGEKKAVKVDGEKILIFHLEDGFYATQNSCTHMAAPLSKGKVIDLERIQCPFHRARFDIRSGEVLDWANFPPGIQIFNFIRSEKALKTYKVTRQEGNLMVEV